MKRPIVIANLWACAVLPAFLAVGCGKKELPRSGGRTASYWARVLQEDESVELRTKAATKLGPLVLIDKAAMPALFAALKDTEADVRSAAARSLGVYSGEKAKDVLPALRELEQLDVDQSVREAARKAIEHLTNPG
jgi:HEAT repeat protein